MKHPEHRFPLRRQIVWSMRIFTALTSLALGAALFFLSNQYVRSNLLQAAEFNLRLVATGIETSFDNADSLLNWASINSTVRRYLSEPDLNGTPTLAAYEAAQEKYYSSPLYGKIIRFFMSNENDRHLQFGALNSSAALSRSSIQLFLQQGYGMQFTTDPLLPSAPACLAISQPIRSGHGTAHRGTAYLALDLSVITDPAAGYAMADGSALYWEMNNRLWEIKDGKLTEAENVLSGVSYTLAGLLDADFLALDPDPAGEHLFAAARRVSLARRAGRCAGVGPELPPAALAGMGHLPPGGSPAEPHRSGGQGRLYGGPVH